MRRRLHCIEVLTGRIQVENHLIGIAQFVDAAEPDVGSDARLVCKIDERGFIVADNVRNRSPSLFDSDSLYPVWEVGRHLLLEETLLIDSVRVAFHGQWPVPQVREHKGGNATVILDQIALGDSFGEMLTNPRNYLKVITKFLK